jgi:hypothetical protein
MAWDDIKVENTGSTVAGKLTADEYNAMVAYIKGIEVGFDIADYRNQAVTNGVAGIYNPCKTLVDEHMSACLIEYNLYGGFLDGTYNPDSWYPIDGNGSVSYSSRVLTLSTLTGVTAAARCVIDQTQFGIASNYLAVICRIDALATGAGGVRSTVIGFQSAFSGLQSAQRAIFYCDSSGNWYCAYNGGAVALTGLSVGRNLQAGDTVEVRLCRIEGSANIDKICFYVNNAKQYETTNIPTSNMYAGVGTYGDSSVTTARTIGISYFGLKYKA